MFVLCIGVTWYVWGSLAAGPIIHDEAAYRLQAELFARLRLVGERPPIPWFFEQFHVLAEPGLTAKYPPGHAALLTPGVWVGLPGLIPLLVTGVSGALLFHLVRRWCGPLWALAAMAQWLGAPGSLVFRPSYLSESSVECAFLVAVTVFEHRRRGTGWAWLVALTMAAVAGALIRPLTALALFAPLAGATAIAELRSKRLVGFAVAAAGATLLAGAWMAWSAGVTGDPRVSPYAQYSKEYMPFEALGFVTDHTVPDRDLPADFDAYRRYHLTVQDNHTLHQLPRIAAQRLRGIASDSWGLFVVPFALLATLGLGARSGRLMVSGTLLVFVFYLVHAHDPEWRPYYLTLYAGAAVLTTSGAMRAAAWTARRWRWRPSVSAGLWATISLGLLAARVPAARQAIEERGRYVRQFDDAVRALPGDRLLVFVRYAPTHSFHQSLVRNSPFLRDARVWIAHDRGPLNRELILADTSRWPYLYEEIATPTEPLRRLVPYLPEP
ncbi:MAG: hypothetical protein JNJ98_01735 [Gemmatimonadetes bacterium]|nr:hypothetical protein [Gemmatimonadota bacterium]